MSDWGCCLLAKHGSQNWGKGKYGQLWPSLVEKLDTPTGFQSTWYSGEGLLNSRQKEAAALALLAACLLGLFCFVLHRWECLWDWQMLGPPGT